MISKGKIFMNGRSQAIRLPLECRFTVDTVIISKIGDTLVIRPEIADDWAPLKAVVGTFENIDLIEDRNQPNDQNERESF
jgi:antitoxin VapB